MQSSRAEAGWCRKKVLGSDQKHNFVGTIIVRFRVEGVAGHLLP